MANAFVKLTSDDSWSSSASKNTKKQGRIHGIRRSPSSFLPAQKKEVTDQRTDGWTDRPTDGHTLL